MCNIFEVDQSIKWFRTNSGKADMEENLELQMADSIEGSFRLDFSWTHEQHDNCLGNIDSRRTQHKDLWMVKREKNGFPNPDKVMKGGVMFKSDFTTTNTDTHIHLFPNFPLPFLESTSLFLRKLEEDNICL